MEKTKPGTNAIRMKFNVSIGINSPVLEMHSTRHGFKLSSAFVSDIVCQFYNRQVGRGFGLVRFFCLKVYDICCGDRGLVKIQRKGETSGNIVSANPTKWVQFAGRKNTTTSTEYTRYILTDDSSHNPFRMS